MPGAVCWPGSDQVRGDDALPCSNQTVVIFERQAAPQVVEVAVNVSVRPTRDLPVGLNYDRYAADNGPFGGADSVVIESALKPDHNWINTLLHHYLLAGLHRGVELSY